MLNKNLLNELMYNMNSPIYKSSVKMKLIRPNLGSLVGNYHCQRAFFFVLQLQSLVRKHEPLLRPLIPGEYTHLVLTAITQSPLWSFAVETVT